MNYTQLPLELVPCDKRLGFTLVRDISGVVCGYYPLTELPDWVLEDLPIQIMAGLTSRNKGKRGEREVVNLLQPHVNEIYGHFAMEPPLLERNQMQSSNGGYDIVGLEWMALEVKFQEQISIGPWWQQTIDQQEDDQVPVLFYRKSRAKWLVKTVVDTNLFGNILQRTVTMELDAYISHFKYYLYYQLRGIKETLDEQGKRS